MTLGQNIRVFEGIVTAGMIALGGFLWQLNGNIASITTTLNNVNMTTTELKADVKELGKRITKAEVQIATIGEAVKNKASKADLLEILGKK